eukprot:scaffold76384_cov77-Phaeocystis_antarctica.AAC.3
MLPPVWCASHVVGEKPPRAAWDRPRVPWAGCWPRLPAAVPPVSLIPRARKHAVASPNRSSTLGRHR